MRASVTKTYAPSATSRFAVARPMPLLPPVTTATFPSSSPMGTVGARSIPHAARGARAVPAVIA
jgi:hypothetical protein